jgi:hypothetical protein
MDQARSNGRSSPRTPPRRRKGAKGTFLVIAVSGVVLFAAGFILLWSLGSVIVGGKGFPWTTTAGASISPVALQAQIERPLEPLVDLRAFRDLSYVPVKGIYVPAEDAGNPKALAAMIAIADQTEINAFVIDVKDDYGKITYGADLPLAKGLGLVDVQIPDLDGLIATLREHNITPIARVIAFRDDALATTRPDLAVQSSKGGIWRDNKDVGYTNPYNHEVWEYQVQLAEDAARHGFREIQFDYVRFPSDGPTAEARYPGAYTTKADAIAGFLAFARERLETMGVWVSADVFGLTTTVKKDQGIGQQFEKISRNVDVICPMVYPSHYDAGTYGIDSPTTSPYELVAHALKDATPRLVGTGAMCRPWLQDFTMGGVQYGVEEVKAQIKAAEEQGYEEWLLWDPSLNYTVGALRSQGS